MTVFNKNSLTQVTGFNNQIIAGELVWEQNQYWNLTLQNSDGNPINLTNATIDAQIIRRTLTNVKDSRNGLTFDIGDYTPTPTPIPLSTTNRSDLTGQFTLLIEDDTWGLMADQPELDINSENGAGFSGRIKISFPLNGATPPYDMIIFLLFIVRSDAIINV
jgi:hypothetical protein